MERVTMDDDLIEDGDDAQDELIGAGPDEPAPARVTPRMLALGAAGLALAAALGYAAWQGFNREAMVPLAVPAAAANTAGQAVERAGMAVEWREGHPWVAASAVARATATAGAALAQTRPAHPSASAADDNVFLSSEAGRAKRLAATMAAIEQMIESQSGVERARVVIAEASRPGAPGTAYSGPTAAATVTMAEGEMSQDLVDAVAALVGGSLPGLPPERVAVIDANANRQRTPRTASERQLADARRERERELAQRLRMALPTAAAVLVTLEQGADACAHAVVTLSSAHAHRVVAASSSLPPDIVLATEEARVTTLAEAVLPRNADGSPARVVVTIGNGDPAQLRTEHTPPIEASGEPITAAIDRERLTPLGPGTAATGAWDAGTLGLLVLALGAVAGALVFAHRRGAGRAVPALAGFGRESVDDAYELPHSPRSMEPAEGTDASEAVRAEPLASVTVVRAWLDAGYDQRAAHLVVALDSGAAGALLRAMPAPSVARVTAALASLRTPTAQELRDAADALVEELAMLREPAHREGESEDAA